jgi:hypothetical protein
MSLRLSVGVVVVGLLVGAAAFLGLNPHILGLFHDDGIYTVVAKSLAEGHGYRILSLPSAPAQTKYPFLYSYLLSWLWAIDPRFPQNILLLKTFNVAIIVTIFFCSVIYYRRSLNNSGIACAVFGIIVCVNPIIFTFTDYVLSDLLLVLFTVVLLALCGSGPSTALRSASAALLAVIGSLACLTRMAAAPLLVAGGVHCYLTRGVRGLVWFGSGVLILLSPWLYWVMVHRRPLTNPLFDYYSAYSFLNANTTDFGSAFSRHMTVIVGNANYLMDAFELLYLAPLVPGLVFLFVAVTIVGMIESTRKDGVFTWIFFLASVALLVVWPFQPSRYVAPLVPLVVLFLFRGTQFLQSWFERKQKPGSVIVRGLSKIAWLPIMVILMLDAVWLSAYLMIRDPNTTRGLYGNRIAYSWSGFQETFAWIREHTPADALLATAYDPMYFLYTNRKAIRPAFHRPASYFYPYGAASPDVGTADAIKFQLVNLRVAYLIIDPMEGYAEGKATLKLFDDLVSSFGEKAQLVFRSSDGKHRIYALVSD